MNLCMSCNVKEYRVFTHYLSLKRRIQGQVGSTKYLQNQEHNEILRIT